ncbi:MAG: hypothetical protein F9K45_12940 [Melioribacteraceae bacterium]|nr:MAG: hypothetical protein F9K45_12940 [Melioribacteraceae bacterium]
MRRNIYKHSIELKTLKIRNSPRLEFAEKLEFIEYRGYEVENIHDGRKIVITKPGGKFTFGQIKKEDFMVFVYEPNGETLWLISHNDIYNDLELKGQTDVNSTIEIINALERVYNGEEPDEIIKSITLINPCGEEPEVLLKAYKWIWGQEDVNYPTGKGRSMSFENILHLKNTILEQRKQRSR